MKYLLQYFLILIILELLQTGCDLREGTIVHDVNFPRADSDEAQGGGSGNGLPAPVVSLSTSLANLPEAGGTVSVIGTLNRTVSSAT